MSSSAHSSSPAGFHGPEARPCGLLETEQETSRESSSDDFVDDCIQRFREFLLNLPELAPLAARVETNVPRFVILNVLRMMTAELTLNIMMGDPPQADVLVQTLAAEHGVNLTAISAGDQLRCAKWLELFASYFADQEIA